MHLIIAAIMALGGLAWAINQLLNGATDAKGAVRRLKWQHRHGKDLVAAIDDPRIAAVILLGQLMRYEGDIGPSDRDRLAEIVEKDLRTPAHEAQEIVAQALYILGQRNDAANELSKLLYPIRDACTPEERADLLRLMNEVAARNGEISPMQQILLDRTHQRMMD